MPQQQTHHSPFNTICRHILAGLSSCVLSSALLTALALPSAILPAVFIGFYGAALYVFRDLVIAPAQATFTQWELALIGYAGLISLLRLTPYAMEGFAGHFSPAVIGDDYWHFQELASLVSSERFPPQLNFAPHSQLHFYYLPWVPAAALAHLMKALTGTAWIKFCYGAGAMMLNLASTAVLILFIRHVVRPAGRAWALGAVMMAGAVPDGVLALLNWQQGSLAHVEWWQDNFAIHNQVSSLTTELTWVPHHLIAAMAVLLGLVLITRPQTLALRTSVLPFAAAGLLAAFAVFSSVFVVLGAAFALLPILIRLTGAPDKLLVTTLAALIPALPLAYIYLDAGASSGFLWLDPYVRWQGLFGHAGLGILGLCVALLFMMAEAGWLAIGLRVKHAGTALGALGLAGLVFLFSTAFVSFDVWNNYAMRGAIVPIVILACWWAQAGRRDKPQQHSKYALAAAALLAGAAHVNELVLYTQTSIEAMTAAPGECEQRVLAANTHPNQPLDPALLVSCKDSLALYSLARPFTKPFLRPADRELMGRQQH